MAKPRTSAAGAPSAFRSRIRAGVGWLILALLLIVAVVLIRTWLVKAPPSRPIALAPRVSVDVASAAKHLGEAIRFQTVTHQDSAQDDPQAWEAQREWIQRTYPHFAAVAERRVYPDGLLIYRWSGSDSRLPPIVLMAHQDVVPVDPATRSRWTAPPFGGLIRDGAVWGRGAIDNKGALVAILEAMDGLAKGSFQPRRTIMLVSGAHEEGDGGLLPAVIRDLAGKGLRAAFVLDEGPWIFEDAQGPGRPAAMIGVAEKGWAMLRIDARSRGGHSSMPSRVTSIETLSEAILRIVRNPAPIRIEGPGAETLRALAPTASFTTRAALANLWLFGPLVRDRLAASPEMAAQFHTTIAPTMLTGSPKENVLPQNAHAEINFRMGPGDTSANVMKRARAAVGDLPVELSFSGYVNEATEVASRDSEGYRAIAGLVQDMEGVPAAPALMVAGTDSRYLSPLTPNIYRFGFMRMKIAAIPMLHGVDEHISLANLKRMIEFQTRLIVTTTR